MTTPMRDEPNTDLLALAERIERHDALRWIGAKDEFVSAGDAALIVNALRTAATQEAESARLKRRVEALEMIIYEEIDATACSDGLNEMLVVEIHERRAALATSETK